jgi:hypothetical protein
VNAPEEFVACCRAEVGKLLSAGKQLAPILSPKELIAKVAEQREETGKWLKQRGYYSWRKAVAQSFVGFPKDEL